MEYLTTIQITGTFLIAVVIYWKEILKILKHGK